MKSPPDGFWDAGLTEGEKKKAIEIAKKLLDIDTRTTSSKTGLTIEEIKKAECLTHFFTHSEGLGLKIIR